MNLKLKQAAVILYFCLRQTLSGKSYDYREVIVFEELRSAQNVFRPNKDAKPSFSYSYSLKSVFEKLRYRDDGLLWTVGLNDALLKFLSHQWMPFGISSGWCVRGVMPRNGTYIH